MLYKHICILACSTSSTFPQRFSKRAGYLLPPSINNGIARISSADASAGTVVAEALLSSSARFKSNERQSMNRVYSCLLFSIYIIFFLVLQANLTPFISSTPSRILISSNFVNTPPNSAWSSVVLSTSPSMPLRCLLFLLESRRLLASRKCRMQ